MPNNPEPEAKDRSSAANASYSISSGFVKLLDTLDVAVAATSYQSGRLYLLGRNPKGGLMVNEQYFQKAMGLHYDGKTLFLATLGHVYRMENILRKSEIMDEQFTDCFVPRTAHLTGALDVHDIGATADGDILFINTRYNCIAQVSDKHSFLPFWKPSFISALVAEDRCHLNGMAMRDGLPVYVTAVSKSDTIDGWRNRRADGGIVLDIKNNEIVCEGLSMPHSPRIYKERLWVLNSGTGELGWVNLKEEACSKRFVPLCFCPGFVRGLAFAGKYAFVGLSRPRYERFEGLELDQRLADADSDPWCGIQVVDLDTGAIVEWFRIDGDIGELYDVEIVPGSFCPRSYGYFTNDIYGIITVESD